MPFPRKRSPLQFSEQDRLRLESIRKSRTEQKRRTVRAAFLLDSLSGRSDEAIARHHHVSRSTVVLDSAYPEHHQIRLVLDNHSAHISKETRGYLQTIVRSH